MKVNISDLKKAIEWVEKNTHAVIVDVSLDYDKHLKIKTEDKYQRSTEITIYTVDRNEKSLLKPTIKKTEAL